MLRSFGGLVLIMLVAACGGPVPPAAPTTTAPPPVSGPVPTSPAPAVDLSTFRRAEIPAAYPDPDLSALPAEPARSTPLGPRIAWKALREVTQFAHVVDPGARSSCPAFDPARTTTATCTVTFLGDRYDYVLSGMRFQGSGLSDGTRELGNVSYKAELTAGPIVRERVESVLRHQNRSEYVACDMPEHVRFAFGPEHRRPSGRPSLAGAWIHVPGIACRVLEPATRTVRTIPLELYESGAPIHPSSRIGG